MAKKVHQLTREALHEALENGVTAQHHDEAIRIRQRKFNTAAVSFAFRMYGDPDTITPDQWHRAIEPADHPTQLN